MGEGKKKGTMACGTPLMVKGMILPLNYLAVIKILLLIHQIRIIIFLEN